MMNTPEARAELDKYAAAVGRLCNAWAGLENITRDVFQIIAGMPHSATTIHMVRCLGLRDLLNAIKIGGVTAATPKVAEEMISTVDYIDGELRTTRNRVVHDQWIYDPDGSVKSIKYDAKIMKKAQAFQPRQIEAANIRTWSFEEVEDAISDITESGYYLLGLCMTLGSKSKVQLGERPQRLLLRHRPEKPRP